jgi:hypothetical protein
MAPPHFFVEFDTDEVRARERRPQPIRIRGALSPLCLSIPRPRSSLRDPLFFSGHRMGMVGCRWKPLKLASRPVRRVLPDRPIPATRSDPQNFCPRPPLDRSDATQASSHSDLGRPRLSLAHYCAKMTLTTPGDEYTHCVQAGALLVSGTSFRRFNPCGT